MIQHFCTSLRAHPEKIQNALRICLSSVGRGCANPVSVCAAKASPRNEPSVGKIKLLVGLVLPGVSGESIPGWFQLLEAPEPLGSGPFFIVFRLVLPLSRLPLLT